MALQVIWDGKLGDGWSMTKSIGVMTPQPPGPGNLTDLCVAFPAHGSLSFSYGAPAPLPSPRAIAAEAQAPQPVRVTRASSRAPDRVHDAARLRSHRHDMLVCC